MKKWQIAALVPGVLVLIVAVFLLTLFLVRVLWAWTVPDLFPGAVEQGLVARSISWFTALKLALIVVLLAGMVRASGKDKS